MKNFPVIYGGKTYWVSRSVAVVIKFTATDESDNEYVLAVQRGSGSPDFVGSWCLPCGYLDYNETTKEAACRELKEETGLILSPDYLTLIEIDDNPDHDGRQNIVFRFKHKSQYSLKYLKSQFTTQYSEKNEIADIRFIPVSELNKYTWAFNHEKLVSNL